MANIGFKEQNGEITVFLKGHIDSENAPVVEQEINAAIENATFLTIDCNELNYISSAGLRIILRLRKRFDKLSLINVTSDVYEVFDMTGFTEMMEIKKAYRVISVEGCEVIGQGANGKVYRIDRDTIVKVYKNPDSLPDIQRERELARKAFVMGIPTAIPYDVVKVGDGYGSVFELLNAKSFANILGSEPERFDEIVNMSVDLLKKIHSTTLKDGDMPDIRKTALGWAEYLKDQLPEKTAEKLYKLIYDVPKDNHMMHGDYHIKNVMLQNGEVLLIDMDTLCLGNPVFEFGSIYNAYIGFCELDHDNVKDFLGIDYDMSEKIWQKTLKLYFDGATEEKLRDVSDKARLIGYTRLLRRTIRRPLKDEEAQKKALDYYRENIIALVDKLDTLVF